MTLNQATYEKIMVSKGEMPEQITPHFERMTAFKAKFLGTAAEGTANHCYRFCNLTSRCITKGYSWD